MIRYSCTRKEKERKREGGKTASFSREGKTGRKRLSPYFSTVGEEEEGKELFSNNPVAVPAIRRRFFCSSLLPFPPPPSPFPLRRSEVGRGRKGRQIYDTFVLGSEDRRTHVRT